MALLSLAVGEVPQAAAPALGGQGLGVGAPWSVLFPWEVRSQGQGGALRGGWHLCWTGSGAAQPRWVAMVTGGPREWKKLLIQQVTAALETLLRPLNVTATLSRWQNKIHCRKPPGFWCFPHGQGISGCTGSPWPVVLARGSGCQWRQHPPGRDRAVHPSAPPRGGVIVGQVSTGAQVSGTS